MSESAGIFYEQWYIFEKDITIHIVEDTYRLVCTATARTEAGALARADQSNPAPLGTERVAVKQNAFKLRRKQLSWEDSSDQLTIESALSRSS